MVKSIEQPHYMKKNLLEISVLLKVSQSLLATLDKSKDFSIYSLKLSFYLLLLLNLKFAKNVYEIKTSRPASFSKLDLSISTELHFCCYLLPQLLCSWKYIKLTTHRSIQKSLENWRSWLSPTTYNSSWFPQNFQKSSSCFFKMTKKSFVAESSLSKVVGYSLETCFGMDALRGICFCRIIFRQKDFI